MNEYDEQHRITKLDYDDPDSHRPYTNECRTGLGGHSVCMHAGCGKDMPDCWDVICHMCSRPYCYDHATFSESFWYCDACIAEQERMFFTNLRNTWMTLSIRRLETDHYAAREAIRAGLRRARIDICHVPGHDDGWVYPGMWPNSIGEPSLLVEKPNGAIVHVMPEAFVEYRDPSYLKWVYRAENALARLYIALCVPLCLLNKHVVSKWGPSKRLWWRIGYHGPYQLAWWALRVTARTSLLDKSRWLGDQLP